MSKTVKINFGIQIVTRLLTRTLNNLFKPIQGYKIWISYTYIAENIKIPFLFKNIKCI